MKKVLRFLLVLSIIFTLVSCSTSSVTDETDATNTSITKSTHAENDAVESHKSTDVIVDISDDYYGYFSNYADVTIEYDKDNGVIYYVHVDNPALLAFEISDRHVGGLGTITGNDLNFVLTNLHEYASNTEMSEEDAEMFRKVLYVLNSIACVEGAST